MSEVDPAHWLFRLDAGQWLRAARTELAQAFAALSARQHRTGVTHARRAAGMAVNGVLVGTPDEGYGRSYMDHLHALAADERAAAEVRAAAAALVAAPMAPALVTLGRQGPTDLAEAAAAVVDWAAAQAGPG